MERHDCIGELVPLQFWAFTGMAVARPLEVTITKKAALRNFIAWITAVTHFLENLPLPTHLNQL
jgi:hypothetical protein